MAPLTLVIKMENFVDNIKEKFHRGEDSEGGPRDHHAMHVAGAALAGVAVGAAGLYAGEKIRMCSPLIAIRYPTRVLRPLTRVSNADDSWEEKKDDIKEDIENMPENAAEWTGEKVGEVEGFGDRVHDGFEEKKDRVEDFGDDVGDAYDAGKQDGRYD
ncbi:hypothetical protein KEM52_005943 [Ascosphaera acerosa]|nr:hypothetical protein KEM52_005943 [Ascosphaera acerosa]